MKHGKISYDFKGNQIEFAEDQNTLWLDYYSSRKIISLFRIEVVRCSDGQTVPFVLRLTQDASQLYISFAQFIEEGLAQGGEFEGIRDWCAKTPGRILRIAAIFHALEYDLPQKHDISAATMDLAIRFGKSLIVHTKIAYEVMGQDPAVELAKRVLAWILRCKLKDFTLRDAQQIFKTAKINVTQVRDGLKVLEERGYLREEQTQKSKGGRTSTLIVVNPKTFSD